MQVPLPNAFPFVRLGAAYRDETDPEDYDIYVDDIGMAYERLGCD
ncbi:MAG: hypothetical protein ACI9KE_001346 [Polyangiales bacterium]|jgi:hypothetical protein